MSEEIKVTVVKVGDNRPLSLRWIDPGTGRPKFKSAGTRNKKVAERGRGKDRPCQHFRQQSGIRAPGSRVRKRHKPLQRKGL